MITQTKGPGQGLMIPRSSHIPGVTDNVLSQIKDNCYEPGPYIEINDGGVVVGGRVWRRVSVSITDCNGGSRL